MIRPQIGIVKFIFYRVLFHHFERFVSECETRFEEEHGYFRRTKGGASIHPVRPRD